MSEPTSNTETQTILADNTEAIVTKGTKSLPKDARVTVIGHDAVTGNYAVRTADGRILTAKEDRVGPAPERTFTETEVRNAVGAHGADAPAVSVLDALGIEH